MPVPNERFEELLHDIEPSTTTKKQASRAHTRIRDHLRKQESFKDRYESSFLSGSYARDTAIRPKTSDDGVERPDVDIIVVTNFTTDDHPDDVLTEVRSALEDDGDGYEVKRVNKRSVRVETPQAEMDIVPVCECLGGFMIPDRETGDWMFTNPPVHTDWSAEKNKAFDGRFKPLVKMHKWWRRTKPTSSRKPKGFVLEMLVAMHGPTDETHYGESFAQTLESIYATYGPYTSLDYKPFIADPAISSSDILAKVTVAQWKEFVEKVRVHAEIARKAQDTDDMEEATRQWRRIFGPRFKPTAIAAKAVAAGTAAIAPAAGYTFPDAMAAPRNTPREFA